MSSIEYAEKSRSLAGTLEDQRVIARSTQCDIISFALGIIPPFYMEISFPALKVVDCILDINIKTVNRATVYGICQKTIRRDAQAGFPIVGFTVCGITKIAAGLTALGITICGECVVVGW